MADSKILQPFILSWEGGYGNHPADKGGPTNKGVTLTTFRQFFGASKTVEDLKKITDDQWHTIFKKGFWDKCKADEIKCQSVANLLVDFAYHSGIGNAVPKIQRIVGTTADGIVGPKTIEAINKKDRLVLFAQLHKEREAFLRTRSNFSTFGKGWLNRLNGIGYGWLVLNDINQTKKIFKDW